MCVCVCVCVCVCEGERRGERERDSDEKNSKRKKAIKKFFFLNHKLTLSFIWKTAYTSNTMLAGETVPSRGDWVGVKPSRRKLAVSPPLSPFWLLDCIWQSEKQENKTYPHQAGIVMTHILLL